VRTFTHVRVDATVRYVDEGPVLTSAAPRRRQAHFVMAPGAWAFMSPRTFSRRFREVTGATAMRWLLEQCLTRARELLEETDESVERGSGRIRFGSGITLRQRLAQVRGDLAQQLSETARS
jgi:transcriptional regulator GlxA family with amidase domain